METHHLRAPSTDGGLLAEPPLAGASALLDRNAERLASWDHDFQGRRASRLRPAVRAQVLDRARRFLGDAGFAVPEGAGADRLVVTGHQPELFHPGVWVKNFAASTIARQAGALALNLIVDNDIPKGSSLRVPYSAGEDLRVRRVDFDARAGETPYEDLDVADEGLFASFPDRVRETLAGVPADPLIDEFWPHALAFAQETPRLGLRFALARHAVEASWGVENLEVPLSTVCETDGFLWFASHLLAHLPRFQQVHNDALARYRDLYGIRSRNHPVPALAQQGEWREAPFWAWRAGEPRRRPLFARQLARTMELRIGGDAEPLMEIPLSADREACCAVERLHELPMRGVRLRTRALTTTMFARYLLGDLFLHGIGGAKYDELGDEVAARFFGFAPPPYMTLSLTLRLGLGDDPGAAGRMAALEHQIRDLDWNPDRHLSVVDGSEEARWIERKRRAIAGPIETHRHRMERFEEIRRCNDWLRGRVADRREALEAERARRRVAVHRAAIARSREYALVLHSRRRLREAMEQALPGLDLSPDGGVVPLRKKIKGILPLA